MAAEHPLVLELCRGTAQESATKEFVERIKKVSQAKRGAEEGEKEGVFTGAYCRNLFTDENIPIYLANFVLMEYGTGAVVAARLRGHADPDYLWGSMRHRSGAGRSIAGDPAERCAVFRERRLSARREP